MTPTQHTDTHGRVFWASRDSLGAPSVIHRHVTMSITSATRLLPFLSADPCLEAEAGQLQRAIDEVTDAMADEAWIQHQLEEIAA